LGLGLGLPLEDPGLEEEEEEDPGLKLLKRPPTAFFVRLRSMRRSMSAFFDLMADVFAFLFN
jgi:hypothetical protein